MLSNKRKELVKSYMNAWGYLVDKRMPTDKDWDRYFIENYTGKVVLSIEGKRGGFLTYEFLKDVLYIKDFVANGDGLQIMNDFLALAGKSIVHCRVHVSNLDVINLVISRFGFRILEYDGCQYKLERR